MTRPTLPAHVMERIEGVAGESAQVDFGHVEVRLVDGAAARARRRVWAQVVAGHVRDAGAG
ncbi:MAG: hypothetical protein ACOVSI_04495, partial [Gemmatimonas sp.]